MIKAQVHQVLAAETIINKLATQEMGVKLTYSLVRLGRAFPQALKNFDKIRLEIMKKNFEEVKDKPGTFTVIDTKKDAFEAELKPHYSDIVEVNANPIPAALLFSSSVSLTPIELLQIELFLDESVTEQA